MGKEERTVGREGLRGRKGSGREAEVEGAICLR